MKRFALMRVALACVLASAALSPTIAAADEVWLRCATDQGADGIEIDISAGTFKETPPNGDVITGTGQIMPDAYISWGKYGQYFRINRVTGDALLWGSGLRAHCTRVEKPL